MANMSSQQNFSNYTILNSTQVKGNATVSNKFIANVFMWMFVALGVSALMAYLFATNTSLMNIIYQVAPNGRMGMTLLGTIITFAPIGFVMLMSFGYSKLSSEVLTLLFVLFAVLMGMSLSSILLIYTSGSVLGCFAASSAMFGIMAFMGYTTDKDLTSFGRLLTMGLIGIVIASVINMFLHNSAMNFIISIVGVAVFTGLTAYDVQKLKRIGAGIEFEGTSAGDVGKLSILGALTLYLDFINLFLMMLRLFGNRRN